MRNVLICCAFWLLLALVILGANRPQILMEDDLRDHNRRADGASYRHQLERMDIV